jgi:hypothetical protein
MRVMGAVLQILLQMGQKEPLKLILNHESLSVLPAHKYENAVVANIPICGKL